MGWSPWLRSCKERKMCWKKQKCVRPNVGKSKSVLDPVLFMVVASAISDRRCLLAQVCEDWRQKLHLSDQKLLKLEYLLSLFLTVTVTISVILVKIKHIGTLIILHHFFLLSSFIFDRWWWSEQHCTEHGLRSGKRRRR